MGKRRRGGLHYSHLHCPDPVIFDNGLERGRSLGWKFMQAMPSQSQSAIQSSSPSHSSNRPFAYGSVIGKHRVLLWYCSQAFTRDKAAGIRERPGEISQIPLLYGTTCGIRITRDRLLGVSSCDYMWTGDRSERYVAARFTEKGKRDKEKLRGDHWGLSRERWRVAWRRSLSRCLPKDQGRLPT